MLLYCIDERKKSLLMPLRKAQHVTGKINLARTYARLINPAGGNLVFPYQVSSLSTRVRSHHTDNLYPTLEAGRGEEGGLEINFKHKI